LARFLSGHAEPDGHHLENIILNDLLVWRDTSSFRPEVLYWRTTSGEEVDLVIEAAGQLLPIEVKASQRPSLSDACHIRSFRAEYRASALPGLVLHALALPWWTVVYMRAPEVARRPAPPATGALHHCARGVV
jgi:uncharacterized protein